MGGYTLSDTDFPKTININARYYLAPALGEAWDVCDRGAELRQLPNTRPFVGGTEQECRDWITRNCEEPVNPIFAPLKVVPKLSGSENHRGFQIIADDFAIAEVYPLDADGRSGKVNAAMFATSPKLLALLEQYHAAMPTRESGALIAEARGWT